MSINGLSFVSARPAPQPCVSVHWCGVFKNLPLYAFCLVCGHSREVHFSKEHYTKHTPADLSCCMCSQLRNEHSQEQLIKKNQIQFHTRTISDWNKLPTDVTHQTTLETFKTALAAHFDQLTNCSFTHLHWHFLFLIIIVIIIIIIIIIYFYNVFCSSTSISFLSLLCILLQHQYFLLILTMYLALAPHICSDGPSLCGLPIQIQTLKKRQILSIMPTKIIK